MNKKLKGLVLLCLITPISFYSCNKNPSKSLWDRTFKSTGSTYVNWNDNVEGINKTIYQLTKENFESNNIDFENSGYYFYTSYGEEYQSSFALLNYIYEFPIDNFNDFKSCIDTWWDNDKELIDDYYSFYGLKKNIDQFKFIFKLDKDSNNNSGQLLIEFIDYNNKPAYDTYYAFDESEAKDGSELTLYKDFGTLLMVGYARVARYSNCIDILQVRSGYNDESAVKFTIKLINPVDNISTYDFYNHIVIKEYNPGLPVWAIILISAGVTAVVVTTVIIIVKKTRKRKI